VLAPAAAQGATVQGKYIEEIRDDFGTISIDDPKGQRNDLRVYLDDDRIVVRERGPGALYAKGNCRKESRRVVSCPEYDNDTISVRVREGDDQVRIDVQRYFNAFLFGGSGDDHLRTRSYLARLDGGTGHDTLLSDGDRGADELYGGAGRDRLRAGPGGDVLVGDGKWLDKSPAKPARDFLDGGRGRDTSSWARRRSPVRVDLRRGVGGATGEGDELHGIENVVGGNGDDRLLGSRAHNRLFGGPGLDTMLGRSGDDRIDGGAERDPAAAFRSADGPPDGDGDRIGCGPGEDLVAGIAVRESERRESDAVPQSCERLMWDRADVAVPRLELGAREVRVNMYCDRGVCRFRVKLRSRGEELGRSRIYQFGYKQTAEVRLDRPLTGGAPIRVVAEGTHGSLANPRPYRLEYRLKRPRAAARAR
jgi:hypothetical protein